MTGSASGKGGLDAQMVSWRMESIRRDSVGGSSDEEFFDCEGELLTETRSEAD